MPLFIFKCPKCDKVIKRITPEEPKMSCPIDKEEMVRDNTPATSIVKEYFDNGLMARKAEVIKKE